MKESLSQYFTIISILLLFSTQFMAQTIDQKVTALLQKMTLEEKIGQMNQYNGFWDFTGPTPKGGDAKKKYEHLRKGWVGSMLNVTGVKQVREIQELVVKESRLGIPLLFGFDVIHGHKTLSPIPLAEAASWDLEAIEASARIAATEAAAKGLSWTFGPMMDISRDARWGRVMEGAGEDAYLGAKVAAARVRGFQGQDLSANNTIAATAKHFAGYGFVEAGKDYNTVEIGTSTLYNVVLPPFKAAVDAGVKCVMNSFSVLNGTPATGDKFLQRAILKGKWNFQGLVISDWDSIGEMEEHGFAESLAHAAEIAITAGCDIDMASHAYVQHLKDLVENGKVSKDLIDEAASRILRLKFELGLFDDPYKYCDETREKDLINHPDHHTAALEMAEKSIVLLKNEGDILPLKKEQQQIALIGHLAEDKTSPLGSWRIGTDDGTAVSVLEGLKQYSTNIKYARGPKLYNGKPDFLHEVDINKTDRSGFEEAIQLAKTSEVVILVLGEHGFQSGEGRSRTNLDLPGLQQELLEAIMAVNKNVVLVLMNGRPLALTWADEHVPAILETWQLGSQSGTAIANTVFGKNNPSGKLPMTFPKNVGQVPIYYSHFNTGRPDQDEDMVFWTHYTDVSNAPLYHFGHGLSYTQFTYSEPVIDATDNNNIKIKVSIKNTGKIAGEEVAQLYIRDKVASVVRPTKELKGFQKVLLLPKEEKEITFHLTDQELGFFNAQGDFIVEPGVFEVMIGGSSEDGVRGSFVKQ